MVKTLRTALPNFLQININLWRSSEMNIWTS